MSEAGPRTPASHAACCSYPLTLTLTLTLTLALALTLTQAPDGGHAVWMCSTDKPKEA